MNKSLLELIHFSKLNISNGVGHFFIKKNKNLNFILLHDVKSLLLPHVKLIYCSRLKVC